MSNIFNEISVNTCIVFVWGYKFDILQYLTNESNYILYDYVHVGTEKYTYIIILFSLILFTSIKSNVIVFFFLYII